MIQSGIASIDFLQIQNIEYSYLKDAGRDTMPFDRCNSQADLPIIIDYGSNTFKAGWGSSTMPDIVVRSIINRTKDNKSTIVVGTAGKEVDIFKSNFQSPYERNLLYHQGAFEHLNDYLFSELRAGSGNEIGHPLIITEPCANTKNQRQSMMECLFEGYGAPSVMVGIDALWSVFSDLNTFLSQTRLVLSFGDQAIHIIPIIDGQVCYSNIKRVNVGGQHSLSLLYKNLQNRHPHLKTYLQFGLIEKIHRGYTQTAIDYNDQIRYFKTGTTEEPNLGYRDAVSQANRQYPSDCLLVEPITISFEAVKQQIQPMVDESESKRKQEIRVKQAERLREALQKKKQEKNQALLQQLEQYETLIERQQTDPVAAKIEIESLAGAKGIEELKKRIKILKVKLGLLPKDALDEEKFSYVDVPDSQLSPEQLNQKRYQMMMKQAAATKAIKKEEEQRKKDEAKKFREQEPDKYLQSLYDRRSTLTKKIDERKKKQSEMNTRNSRFNQRRMQTLAYLGADQLGKEDNFGIRDEDWDLYRGITKELDSDDENAEFKLQELELEIRELDPDFDEKITYSKANIHQLGMELLGLTLSVDRVKCNEVYFKPTLVGIDQCGLIDAIILSIRQFDRKVQERLLSDVYLTGGAAQTQGLSSRLQQELRKEYDPSIKIQVNVSPDPVFDAWKGMKSFYSKHPQMVSQFSISRDDYMEQGGYHQDLFKVHPFSNIIE